MTPVNGAEEREAEATGAAQGPSGSPGTPLLLGIVGSHAHGLAGPDSDVDRLGVYAAPTRQFHGLHLPVGRRASRVTTNPDTTLHEAGKYLALALRANPTVTELLWLPENLLETTTPLGADLIAMRGKLLGARHVRSAYLGYATQQVKRLQRRGDGSFSSDTRKRSRKHARHLMRLCQQGLALYRTGELTVRVVNPPECAAFADEALARPHLAQQLVDAYARRFDTAKPALPAEPNRQAAEAWLHRVRDAHYTRGEQA